MIKTKKVMILVLIFNVSINLLSQTPKLLDPLNTPIFRKSKSVKSEGINWWKCDSLNCGQLFTTLKPFTGLGVNDSMVLLKEWEDSITLIKHVKYQQYYKNIKMENVHYVEHSLDCKVLFSNGFICEGMDKTSIPVLTEAQALQEAIEHVGVSKTFAWEDDSLEYYLVHDSESSYLTYYPVGELMWAHVGNRSIIPANFKLAWKFRIWAIDSPSVLKYVYVDAMDGSILKDPNVSRHSYGNFNHIYYGNKNIDTRWLGGSRSKYFLETDNGDVHIKTKDDKHYKKWKTHDLPDDNDDSWNNSRWAATASHWAVQEAWYYWKDVWLRNGVDNNKKPIKVFADINDFNAFYIDNHIGDGSDVIAFGRFE